MPVTSTSSRFCQRGIFVSLVKRRVTDQQPITSIAITHQVNANVALTFTSGQASDCQSTQWSDVICTPFMGQLPGENGKLAKINCQLAKNRGTQAGSISHVARRSGPPLC